MNMQEYQEKATRTAMAFSTKREALASGVICLAGEVGELCNKVKKFFWHGHKFSDEELKDELGDILWYIAALADSLDFTLEEIAEQNIEKLRKRYPEGWDAERSKSRE